MEKNHTIIWLQSVDSTNSEARRQLSDIDNMSVLAARCQTAGRGQRGNTWTARPGENLTFSIVLKFGDSLLPAFPAAMHNNILPALSATIQHKILPALPAAKQHSLSLTLTVALSDYLSVRGLDVRIKWPNDIYCHDRKICGILIENTVQGNSLSTSILGVGLNVNQTEFPADLPNPTSMALELMGDGSELGTTDMLNGMPKGGTIPAFDIEKELEAFLGYFDKRLGFAFTPDGRQDLRTAYLRKMYGLGQSREFVRAGTGERFTGVILGVTDDFRLRVWLDEDGREEVFAFKEIKYLISGREQV